MDFGCHQNFGRLRGRRAVVAIVTPQCAASLWDCAHVVGACVPEVVIGHLRPELKLWAGTAAPEVGLSRLGIADIDFNRWDIEEESQGVGAGR
jgi:hypothetical protein